nr:TonB-dependent receptor plug domain-containing protein [Prevotella sp.]
MKKYFILLLFTVFSVYTIAAPMYQKTSLKGHVADAADKAPLVGVTIYIPELSVGTTTDIDGNYVLEDLPCKQITLQVSYLGHQTIIEKLNLASVTTKDFLLKESNAFINEVIVTGLSGNTLLKDSPTPVSVVSSADLQATSSTNVIDAIAHQPGISQITTGSGISKPVIRGLGYNRIVTVNNDVRQEGQQWGDEHGIEIDPQTVDHVEILKGPASLMYGSDAMAGVVIFHDAPTLSKGKMAANVSSEYQTNNGLFDYSFNFAGNLSGIVWNTRYSEKMAHAYKNKYDGYVLGSQFRERALSGMLGVNKNWGYSHLTLSYYHLTPSMTEGERDEKTGEFVKPILSNGEESECIASHHDLTTYGKGLPYQQIHHYKAILNNSVYIGNGQLNAIIGYQQNRRQEFEDVASPDKPGLDFMLHTVNYDVHYSLEQKDGLNVTGGVNGMYQRSLNKGDEYLIPAYALFDFGAFVTSGYKKDKINISCGLRFDTRHLHSFALE